jgi:hypothetical protein
MPSANRFTQASNRYHYFVKEKNMAGGSSIRHVPVQPTITPADAQPANGHEQPEPLRSNIPSNGPQSLRNVNGDGRMGNRLRGEFRRTRPASTPPRTSGASRSPGASSTSSTHRLSHVTSQERLDDMSDILSGIEGRLDEADGQRPPGHGAAKPAKGSHSVESLTQKLDQLNDRIKKLDHERQQALLKDQAMQDKLTELQAYRDDADGQLLTTEAQTMVNSVNMLCKIMLKGQEAALRLIS